MNLLSQWISKRFRESINMSTHSNTANKTLIDKDAVEKIFLLVIEKLGKQMVIFIMYINWAHCFSSTINSNFR